MKVISKGRGNKLMGAAFLMATSAVGPGFITQTMVFTQQLMLSFGFAILVSIIVDLLVQWNIWRAVVLSGNSAPSLANKVTPGAGVLLTALVAVGGLIFNIGNVAGAGLGLQAATGLPQDIAAGLSGLLAMGIFTARHFGKLLDATVTWLGLLMLVLLLATAMATQPPVGAMLFQTIVPEQVDAKAILTLVGGTVGGYISFAGAHRYLSLQDNTTGSILKLHNTATLGIVLSGLVRVLLYAAIVGVLISGFVPNAANPVASLFKQAWGHGGGIIFGIILWCAALTSILGASFTSITFLSAIIPQIHKRKPLATVVFIAISTLLYLFIGQPVQVLVWAGTLNGLVLPVGLAFMLLAAKKLGLLKPGQYATWLWWAGWVCVLLMTGLATSTILNFTV